MGIAKGLIYLAKKHGITLLLTSLLEGNDPEEEASALEISTIADTWIHLSYHIVGGERNRALTIIKSRGTAHSNQVRELILSDTGISLADVFTAGGEVLMGTLRYEKEIAQKQEAERLHAEVERRRRELEAAEASAEARIQAIRHEIDTVREELTSLLQHAAERAQSQDDQKAETLRRRRGEDD
jgi:circadian clock protein KaiC